MISDNAATVAELMPELPQGANVMRPFGMSRSTPTLAAAYDLRKFSLEKRRSAPDRPASVGKGITLERIDLLGGNGRWRQKKAEVEFARREAEEREQRRQQKILEEEKRRKRELIEKRRRQQLEDEERRRREEADRQRREAEHREKKRREAEVQKKVEREEAEREWVRRQPITCEICAGGKKCKKCGGAGFVFSMFLVPTVTKEVINNYGRLMQGCDECGGYKQNLLADLKKGSGKCNNCMGVGKTTPQLEPLSPVMRKRIAMLGLNTAGMSLGTILGDVSPKSPSDVVALSFGMH